MFTLMKWNGKYDTDARFIVRDDKTNKFTLFTPDRLEDITWVKDDMSKFPEYKNWDDFGHEKVDYLENVMM